jgi:hypothetical protein
MNPRKSLKCHKISKRCSSKHDKNNTTPNKTSQASYPVTRKRLMSESERHFYRLREQIATEAQNKISKNQKLKEKLLGVKEEPENTKQKTTNSHECNKGTSTKRKGRCPRRITNESKTVDANKENLPHLCLINEKDESEQSRSDNSTTSSSPQPPSTKPSPTSPTPEPAQTPPLQPQEQICEHKTKAKVLKQIDIDNKMARLSLIKLSQFLNQIPSQEKQQQEENTASKVRSDSEDNYPFCDCSSDESAEELVKQAENHAKMLREETKHIANDTDNDSESSNDSDSESSKDASNFAINWSLPYLPRSYYDANNDDDYYYSENETDQIKEDEVNYIHSQYDLLYGRCKAYVQECNEIMGHILKGRDLSKSQVKQLTNRIMFCNPIAHFECDLNWK